MPRRNRPKNTWRTRLTTPQPPAPTYQQMAVDLVRRGLVSHAVLGPLHWPYRGQG